MVTELRVTLSKPVIEYPIHIGCGSLENAGSFLKSILPHLSQALIVTEPRVGALFGNTLQTALKSQGIASHVIEIESGESKKTHATIEHLYSKALTSGIKRNDAIIALGGGIIGDMTGFFAASYLRGVPFFQVPTTLLAQVDASVGGKVGVNFEGYKNMVGAFYHPHGVLIDVDTLNTLPKVDFACGMAEVTKYALIEKSIPNLRPDTPLFETLQQPCESLMQDLPQIIHRCCEMKATVVQADPEERHGVRELLNFGHTFAHAYETLSQGQILHGQAVAIGMVDAFKTAIALNLIGAETLAPVEKLLQQFMLPITSPTPFKHQAMIDVMLKDKKVQNAHSLRLILPENELGQVTLQDNVSCELIATS